MGTADRHHATSTEPPVANAAIRIPELARRLGVCERTAWALVWNGTIRSVRAGHCRLIPESAIAEFLAGDDGGLA